MILGFARFKNRFEKNKQNHEKTVSEKWCKKHWKIIKKVIQNGAKNHQQTIQKSMRKKVRFFDANPGPHGTLPKPTEHLQFNKTTPEETYINRKKQKNHQKNVSEKWCKKHWKIINNVIKNGAKNH